MIVPGCGADDEECAKPTVGAVEILEPKPTIQATLGGARDGPGTPTAPPNTPVGLVWRGWLDGLPDKRANQVPAVARGMYDAIMASDFPARAAAIAKSIREADPDVIGFQEVSDIRTQSPGDLVLGGQQPAETPVLDLLKILEQQLEAEGLDYKVVHKVRNNDFEVPMATDTGTAQLSPVSVSPNTGSTQALK